MRASTMVLKQDEIVVVSDERGDIGPGVAGAGVYFHDTRFLSDYHLLLSDEVPELLDSSAEFNAIGIAQFGNPCLETAEGGIILPNTIGLRRYRVIEQSVIEQLELHNYNDFPVSLELSITLAADFRDIFDIRGFRRIRRGRVLLPRRDGSKLILSYRAPDDVVAETEIRFNRPPDEVTIEAGAGYTTELEELRTMLPGHDRVVRTPPTDRPPRATLLFRVDLDAHDGTRLEMRLTPRLLAGEHRAVIAPESLTWSPSGRPTDEAFPAVRTSNEIFNKILDRSLRDLLMLITPFPGGRLIAAGIPWYVAPFGRDSLITALQVLMFSPDLAVETLRFLSRKQGRRVDPWTEEEPGKILHEQRFGEMARLGEIPHTPYYGTVDATPLFIILFCELMRWAGTPELFNEFMPSVESALLWIDRYGDANGDGFVDYGEPTRDGLVNEGWKDSDNSLQFPDGSPVTAPIALVEVQGYVYHAKSCLAGILDIYGDPARAAALRNEAEELRQRFEQAFWSEPDQFYGQAIDGTGRLVPAISSNPGHCLFSGIVSPERAGAVVHRLRAADMYSGWGIRTLSTTMPHYNPMSYHNGSVWPHDNSLIVAGFRRYGFDDDAIEAISDMLDAACYFQYCRLPELFCGFSREFERHTMPISYPVSCSPQAWAAGTVPLMLQVILGLEPDAAARRITLNPYLPEWLDEVRIRGLRFSGEVLDLHIRGQGRDVDVDIAGARQVDLVVNGSHVPTP